MSAKTVDRNFPVLHLADGPETDDPAEARKRTLKQLADRLDEHHDFAKGQFVAVEGGAQEPEVPGRTASRAS